jgi:hypothetical protein
VRKHKRLVLDLPVAVATALDQSGHKTFLLRTVDISAGGVLIRSERGMPVGTDVRVVLFLRSNPLVTHRYLRIAFHGTVVRSEPGRFAVAFAEAGLAARLQSISELVVPVTEISRSISKRPDREET